MVSESFAVPHIFYYLLRLLTSIQSLVGPIISGCSLEFGPKVVRVITVCREQQAVMSDDR